MIDFLKNYISKNYSDWLREPKGRLDFLKLQAGESWRNPKVSFLIFENKKPICFVKTVRDAQYNFLIENGFINFKKAYDLLKTSSLAESISIPFLIDEYQGVKFSIESTAKGPRLSSCDNRKSLKKVLKWLIEFQSFAKETAALDVPVEIYFKDILKKFLETFQIKEQEFASFLQTKLAKHLNNCPVEKITPIFQHGDFTPDNIILKDENLFVIDWDNYGKIDLPAFDLLTLLERWRDDFYFKKDKSVINFYLRNFGIDEKLLPLIYFGYELYSLIRKRNTLKSFDPEMIKGKITRIS